MDNKVILFNSAREKIDKHDKSKVSSPEYDVWKGLKFYIKPNELNHFERYINEAIDAILYVKKCALTNTILGSQEEYQDEIDMLNKIKNKFLNFKNNNLCYLSLDMVEIVLLIKHVEIILNNLEYSSDKKEIKKNKDYICVLKRFNKQFNNIRSTLLTFNNSTFLFE
jgi:hypothetical protein